MRTKSDRFGNLVEVARVTFTRCAYWGHVSHFKREINLAEYDPACHDEMRQGCGECSVCEEQGVKFVPLFDDELMWVGGVFCDTECSGLPRDHHHLTCPERNGI